MTRPVNPFDSTRHRFLLIIAALLLMVSMSTALSSTPEITSTGQGISLVFGEAIITLLAATTACIGIVISQKVMRAHKKSTGISKQATWYLFFYLIVLILPILLTSIGTGI